jgi:A-macroglobulin TED domain/Alpha-2-macroglobulin family/MG2 domain/Alpha-2-macroglobulin bait region domain/A-macroglobulin receptor binding domain
MNKNHNNHETSPKQDNPAVDGLLREMRRGGLKDDERFIQSVMGKIIHCISDGLTFSAVRSELPLFSSLRVLKFAASFVIYSAILVLGYSLFVFSSHAEPTELFIFSRHQFVSGKPASFIIMVRNGRTLQPIRNEKVTIELFNKGQSQPFKTVEVTTDRQGMTLLNMPFPTTNNSYSINVKVNGISVSRPLVFEQPGRCMLSSDKPIYQPGQTIQIRGLFVNSFTQKPLNKLSVKFEVHDPKDNLVFKYKTTSSEYGIAATSFKLAKVVNHGKYRIVASYGEKGESERIVEVKPYRLPVFGINLKLKKHFYLPDETVTGEINSDYFYGMPVNNAKITLQFFKPVLVRDDSPSTGDELFDRDARTFRDEQYYKMKKVKKEFFKLEGATDKAGVYHFSMPLTKADFDLKKTELLGCKVKITVIDGAGQQHSVKKDITIAEKALRLVVIPEYGKCLPNRLGSFFIYASYPDGRPAAVTVTIPGLKPLQTSLSGLAVVELNPANYPKGVKIKLHDNLGNRLISTVALAPISLHRAFIIQTDKSVYQSGDSVLVRAIANAAQGDVYFELTDGKFSLLTKLIKLANYQGTLSFTLPADVAGTLQLHAYRFLPNGNSAHDLRLIQVNKKSELQVGIKMDRQRYRPGGIANLQFSVKTLQGKGVPAALGVAIVDQAVFELNQSLPGHERFRLLLQEHLTQSTSPLMQKQLLSSEQNSNSQSEAGYLLRQGKHGSTVSPSTGESFATRENVRIKQKLDYAQTLMTVLSILSTICLVIFIAPVVNFALELIFTRQKKSTMSQDLQLKIHDILGFQFRAYTIFLLLLITIFIILIGLPKHFLQNNLWLVNIFLPLIIALPGSWLTIATIKKVKLIYRCSSRVEKFHKILFLLPINAVVVTITSTVLLSSIINTPKIPLLKLFIIIAAICIILLLFSMLFISWMFLNNNKVKFIPNLGLGMGYGHHKTQWLGWLISACLFTVPLLLIIIMMIFTPMAMFLPFNPIIEQLGGGGSYGGGGRYDISYNLSKIKFPDISHWEKESENNFTMPRANNAIHGIPHIRRYFPETLYWNPQLITDGNGNAAIQLKMADSITGWQVATGAIDKNGAMGSANRKLITFQKFFIDCRPPLQMTVGDLLELPVSLYNYQPKAQTVRLNIKSDNRLKLYNKNLTVTLPPHAKQYISLKIKALKPGKAKFIITANGDKLLDGLERQLKIIPAGIKKVAVLNRTLDGATAAIMTLPQNITADSASLVVKIYPSIIPEILDGLDAMLRQPYGCFEQTSSITYPNILILDYLQKSKQSNPKLEQQALKYIASGHQRLLTFEASGGGFSWYGKSKADPLLSAYALMEFSAMQKVYPISSDILQRTYHYISAKQNSDGSWSARGNKLAATAYITLALAESGHSDELNGAFDFIIEKSAKINDAYLLALCANALMTGKQHVAANIILKKLYDQRHNDDKFVWWEAQPKTEGLFYSYGGSLSVETTALILNAMLDSGDYSNTVQQGLAWLISKKENGLWHSTQTTIQALKTLTKAAGKKPHPVSVKPSTITVTVNGRVKTVKIAQNNINLLQYLEFDNIMHKGNNSLKFSSDNRNLPLNIQAACTYYIPSAKPVVPVNQYFGSFDFSIGYDTTKVKVGETVNANAFIRFDGKKTAMMPMMELAIPPGFSASPQPFADLEKRGIIVKYTMRGDKVILYFRQFTAKQIVKFSYKLLARYPGKVTTPPAKVYLYYNPECQATAQPLILEVIE